MVGLREERVGAQSPEAFRHAMGALEVVETPRPLGVSLINYALKEAVTHLILFPILVCLTILGGNFGGFVKALCISSFLNPNLIGQLRVFCETKSHILLVMRQFWVDVEHEHHLLQHHAG